MKIMHDFFLNLNNTFFRNSQRVLKKAGGIIKPAAKADIAPLEYSYYVNEAQKLGIESSILDNKILQLRNNGSVQNVWRSYTDLDGEASLMIAGDKAFCSSLLRKHGIPVPDHAVLPGGDFRGAIAFWRASSCPIVIKPAKNTGDSKGVFLKPDNPFSIWYAVTSAGMYGNKIIVEKFFEGTNYRLLFCKGEFLAASSRNPAEAIGDGAHTIRELIHTLNMGRMKNGECIRYDPKTRPILYKIPVNGALTGLVKRQGFNLDSVPGTGTKVRLQHICHWLYGGQYLDVTDSISPDFIALGKKIVNILGIKLAGIDLIAQDIKSAEPGTYVINEANTTPGLLVHYEVQNRENMRPVARDIIRAMFSLS